MRGLALRWSILLTTAALISAAPRVARDRPGVASGASRAAPANWESPTDALACLQRAQEKDASAFVIQSELDDLIHESGGGACVSAAGIDLLQALRVMA